MLKLNSVSLAVVIALSASCSNWFPTHKDKGSHNGVMDEVRAKRDFYLSLSEDKIRGLKWGWPDDTGDAFLWTCLYRAGGGSSDHSQAILPDGRPLRNPEISPAQSKTPWSKDMETGFAWCMYSHPDREAALAQLRRHLDYGEKHDWDLCGDAKEYNVSIIDRLSRCKISGALQGTLYRTYKRLGGSCSDLTCQGEISNPANSSISVGGDGFVRHLGVIHQSLRAFVDGKGITGSELNQFKKAAEDEPNNALYSCTYHRFKDGDTSKAAQLLLDERLFPAHRLPSKAETCTFYLYQRDEITKKEFKADGDGCISYFDKNSREGAQECGLEAGKTVSREVYNPDWLPCGSEEEVRVPVDWLFAARCVLGE